MSALLAALFAAVQAIHTSGTTDAVPGMVPKPAREGLTIDLYRGIFDTSSFFFKYSRRQDEVVKEKWGDYFFSLSHGYSPKNGGWDRWNFLQVHVKTAKGVVDVLPRSLPVVFLAYQAGEAEIIAAEWAVAGESDRLKLRFVKFPSHPDWLFLQIDPGSLSVDRFAFSCYPGNAAVPEGRERHLATREKDWCLNAAPVSFTPESPYLLMFSRYVDDQFGNKFVFEPAQFSKLEVSKSASSICPRLYPKAASGPFVFALGYFAHRDPDDQLMRFLQEDGDAVRDFLKGIDFAAMPSERDFRESVKIALSVGVAREVLKPLCQRYQAALAAHDIATVNVCEQEVRSLRAAAVRAGLAGF